MRGRSGSTAIGPRLLGIEHEFRVCEPDGTQLDVSALIDELSLDGVRLDPGDPHAVRGPHGGVVTADGREAEIATPPIGCSPTALDTLAAHAAAATTDLDLALGTGRRLEGYSTHLNVGCSERRCRHVADRLAGVWAPALMLLSLRAESPGLLVRPRWRRLELGCEYLPDHFWRPALAFAAGAVTIAERRGDLALTRFDVTLVPSAQRFGWYVDRAAFGTDLLAAGRTARLLTLGGASTTAHDVLSRTWDLTRECVAESFAADTVAAIDAVVSGDAPLPCESDGADEVSPTCGDVRDVPRLPLTYAVGDHVVRPCAFTWRRAVFEITGPGKPRWITVDGTEVRAFYEALHDGRLDHALRAGHRRLPY